MAPSGQAPSGLPFLPLRRPIVLSRVSFVTAALFVATGLHAQVVGGTINGVVTDASGASIRGVAVIVQSEETGTQRLLTTDAAGAYAAPSVPVGRYTISVTREGFAPQSRTGINLTVGQAVRID